MPDESSKPLPDHARHANDHAALPEGVTTLLWLLLLIVVAATLLICAMHHAGGDLSRYA